MFDLERSKVGVNGEDVDQLERREDVGCGKQSLREERSEAEIWLAYLTSDMRVGSQVSHFSLGRLMVLMPREDLCCTCRISRCGLLPYDKLPRPQSVIISTEPRRVKLRSSQQLLTRGNGITMSLALSASGTDIFVVTKEIFSKYHTESSRKFEGKY